MLLFNGQTHFDTTVIIGNGFDLNLGMNTSYQSFFKVLKDNHFFESHEDNPLLWNIYQSGEKENWYDFESIIKKYATDSEQYILLRNAHDLCAYLDAWKKTCCGSPEISGFQRSLESISPSINKLVEESNADIKTCIQIIDDIKTEINRFCQKCHKEAEEAIKLLTDELKGFLQDVYAKIEYDNPAIFLFFATLGITGKGYKPLVENLLHKFDGSNINGDLPKNCLVSFNYTDTAEKILSNIETKIEIALTSTENELVKSINSKIFNIHGTLQDKIAFGTDKDITSIPKEFYCLMKCNYTKEDELANMKEILFHSKRVVFFGHCIYGIDFEYYKEFFEQKKNTEVCIVFHNKEAMHQTQEELTRKDIFANSYQSILTNEEDFQHLLNRISGEYL